MSSYIINGSGGSGKDTFVQMVEFYLETPVVNLSSIDPYKQAARYYMGWDGQKSKEAREFLSKLKQLSIEFNDHPRKYITEAATQAHKANPNSVVFIHIREPEEIQKVKEALLADTIIVVDSNDIEYGNPSDDNVWNYEYDFIIENYGSLQDLKKQAYNFCVGEGFIE